MDYQYTPLQAFLAKECPNEDVHVYLEYPNGHASNCGWWFWNGDCHEKIGLHVLHKQMGFEPSECRELLRGLPRMDVADSDLKY